jgi:hypothetical protein
VLVPFLRIREVCSPFLHERSTMEHPERTRVRTHACPRAAERTFVCLSPKSKGPFVPKLPSVRGKGFACPRFLVHPRFYEGRDPRDAKRPRELKTLILNLASRANGSISPVMRRTRLRSLPPPLVPSKSLCIAPRLKDFSLIEGRRGRALDLA